MERPEWVKRTELIGAYEQNALAALWRWLDEHPTMSGDRAMIWPDGRPVALDVLSVISQLRARDPSISDPG